MKNFHKRGGLLVFILLFRNLKAQNGIFRARIGCFDVSKITNMRFIASILLNIWISYGSGDYLRCFVAFWFRHFMKVFHKIRLFLKDGFPKLNNRLFGNNTGKLFPRIERQHWILQSQSWSKYYFMTSKLLLQICISLILYSSVYNFIFPFRMRLESPKMSSTTYKVYSR